MMPKSPRMPTTINYPSMDEILAEVTEHIANGTINDLPSGIMTIVADHVRAAVEGSSSITPARVEDELQRFLRAAFAAAPKATRQSVQGTGAPEATAAFLLGQAAFAHLLAARVLDTRVDERFTAMLEDKRFELYLRALLDGPKDGVTLVALVEEAAETVSRKLVTLREAGLVIARQQGKRVINKLAPAARAMLDRSGIEPLRSDAVTASDKEQALASVLQETPLHMRDRPSFRYDKKAVA